MFLVSCGIYLSLYCMGERWYNPATGRFLTKDSYPPDLLAPLTQNPYQYCGNNPVNRVDPEGRADKVAWSTLVFVGGPASLYSMENYGQRTMALLAVAWTAYMVDLQVQLGQPKTEPRQLLLGAALAVLAAGWDLIEDYVSQESLVRKGLGGSKGLGKLESYVAGISSQHRGTGGVTSVCVRESLVFDPGTGEVSIRYDVVLKSGTAILGYVYWNGREWADVDLFPYGGQGNATP